MYEFLGGLAAIGTIFCVAVLPLWKCFTGKTPTLRRYTITPDYGRGMAHVSLTLRAGNAVATVVEITCPGCKLHYCPSTFTGFTLASPERFSDSLTFDVELKPSGADRDISFLITPIPNSEFLVNLRISETSRSITYSLTQMHKTTMR